MSFQCLISFIYCSYTVKLTHCGKFVCRDFLLAFCNCVEEQVLQTGQDACLPSPAGKQNKNKKHPGGRVRKNNSTARPPEVQTRRGAAAEGGEEAFCLQGEAVSNNCNTALENITLRWPYFRTITCGKDLDSIKWCSDTAALYHLQQVRQYYQGMYFSIA